MQQSSKQSTETTNRTITPKEQKIAFANHQKRIENSGSGTRRVLIQDGHQEQFSDGRKAQVQLSADTGGFAPGLSGQDPVDWRSDVTGAINYLQQAIEKLGKENPGINRALASLLSTANVLVQSSDSTVERAGINIGATQKPVVSKSNEAAKRGGVTIDIAQWAKECPAILKLAAKYPAIFEAANE